MYWFYTDNVGNSTSVQNPTVQNASFFAGKLQNIEGIAESTEDDINNENIAEIAKSTTEDYHYVASASKKAPKPKTIPQGTWLNEH